MGTYYDYVHFNPIIVLFLTSVLAIITALCLFQSYYSLIFNGISDALDTAIEFQSYYSLIFNPLKVLHGLLYYYYFNPIIVLFLTR